MKYDAHEKTNPDGTTTFHADVCIVGSGAAGLTLAHELIGSGKTVIVLESSAVSVRHNPPRELVEALRRTGVPRWNVPPHRYDDPTVQPIYRGGSDTAEPDSDDFFLNQRIRVYGGTTNCWGGWTRPLADIDFDRTAIDPFYKWPITARDLAEPYSRAMDYCSLGKREAAAYDSPDFWLGKAESPIAVLDPKGSDLRTLVFTQMYNGDMQNPPYDGRLDFQLIWGPYIEEAADITLYTNANVISVASSKDSIAHLVVKTIAGGKEGHEFKVVAKQYVLAASCIENARLLLLSDGLIGPLGPALGKYLFTHPMVEHVAKFETDLITDDVQHRAAIRTFYCGYPSLKNPMDYKPSVFAALAPTKTKAASLKLGNFRVVLDFDRQGSLGNVNFAWEQLPDVSNYVYLGPDTKPDPDQKYHDMFGKRRARAKLELKGRDNDTYKNGLELVRVGLEKMGVAVKNSWKETHDPVYLPGAHAMGTTRMSTSKSLGVVNTDCRAHDIDNLYIAGSSVFPMGGFSNPTLTVIALAIRLADHLKTLA